MEVGKEEGEDCGLEKSLRGNRESLAISRLVGKPQLFSHVQDHVLVTAITTSSLSISKQLPLSSSKKLYFVFPSSFHLPLSLLSPSLCQWQQQQQTGFQT